MSVRVEATVFSEVLAAGVHVIWSISRPITGPNAIFAIETGQWVVSFYSLALATNLIATGESPLTSMMKWLMTPISASRIQDLVDTSCCDKLTYTQGHAMANYDHHHRVWSPLRRHTRHPSYYIRNAVKWCIRRHRHCKFSRHLLLLPHPTHIADCAPMVASDRSNHPYHLLPRHHPCDDDPYSQQ